MNREVEMVLRYPTILPIDSATKQHSGFITVNSIDYDIRLEDRRGRLKVWLPEHLRWCADEINGARMKSSEVVAALDKIKTSIHARNQAARRKTDNLADLYRHVLSEFVELRQFYFNLRKCRVAADLGSLEIGHADESGRMHEMVVGVDFFNTPASGNVFSVTAHDLPCKDVRAVVRPHNSLKRIYDDFVKAVESLEPFYCAMDELDGCCWILDPEKPARKDAYRRIVIGDNTSAVVTVNPWNMSGVPEFKFLGPEGSVEGFRQKLAGNVKDWDCNGNLSDEILRLLELEQFPPKPETSTEDEILLCDVGECCICFSLRLEDLLPEIICQNPSCKQYFHKECLYQWLTSVGARKAFNELHGECPNCEKRIFCPI